MDKLHISEFLDYCHRIKRLSKHTIRAYKSDLSQYYNSDNTSVNDYIEKLFESSLKPNSIRRKIACLKCFYKFLKTKNIITDNPLEHQRYHFNHSRPIPKTIPYDDLQKMYRYLEYESKKNSSPIQTVIAERNLLIFQLLLSTGLRVSELCKLKLTHINLNSRVIFINGKGNKERQVFIGDENTLHNLRKYIRHHLNSDSNYLFPGKVPNSHLSEQTIRLFLGKLQFKTETSTKVTPHMFRHSFATMLLDKNVNIRYIQQILGHSSISITQIYTHVSKSKQQEILTQYNPLSSIISKD